LLIDHPDFASPNPLVHAGAVTLPEVTFCDKFPLTNVRRQAARLAGHGPECAHRPTAQNHEGTGYKV
jgi:hypothetical protein